MKNTSILLILLTLFSCGSTQRGAKGLTAYHFNGQVFIDIPEKCIPNMKRTITLKSKLTLMKQDSTVITETITDSLGNFDTMVAIDTSWNPLLLKVKGLEDYVIDSISFTVYCGTRFLCTESLSLHVELIDIYSDQNKQIEVNCLTWSITRPEQ